MVFSSKLSRSAVAMLSSVSLMSRFPSALLPLLILPLRCFHLPLAASFHLLHFQRPLLLNHTLSLPCGNPLWNSLHTVGEINCQHSSISLQLIRANLRSSEAIKTTDGVPPDFFFLEGHPLLFLRHDCRADGHAPDGGGPLAARPHPLLLTALLI